MNIKIIIGVLISSGIVLVLVMRVSDYFTQSSVPAPEAVVVHDAVPIERTAETERTTASSTAYDMLHDLPPVEIVAENLTIPWDIVFLPGGDLLVSERDGTLVRFGASTAQPVEIVVKDVVRGGEGGLLGMVAHPRFVENRYLYLYRTSTLGDGSNASVNEVVRYLFVDNELRDRKDIITGIPGSLFHNGGRIAFGPDDYLYVATGDARDPDSAQDLDSLAGKILRVTDEGLVPDDNPFGTLVYSYGHRNPQGLTWDTAGRLWSTEHGRTTLTETGMDELNLIEAGRNYGWPNSEGDTVEQGTVGPQIHSGAAITWAPASAVFWDGSVFFGGLKGETLYEAVLDGTTVLELREHFNGEYGRIRTVLVGPDGALYITTSNRDTRGTIHQGDDKVIRLNPLQFRAGRV